MAVHAAYPPEGCRYRVDHGGQSRWFADEHELMAWFAQREKAGDFTPEFADEEYRIYCETADDSVEIGYRHPRLIHARLFGRRSPELGPRSSPGTARPPLGWPAG